MTVPHFGITLAYLALWEGAIIMTAAFNTLANTIHSHDSGAGRGLEIAMVFSSSWKGRESHPAGAYVSGNFNRKGLRK